MKWSDRSSRRITELTRSQGDNSHTSFLLLLQHFQHDLPARSIVKVEVLVWLRRRSSWRSEVWMTVCQIGQTVFAVL